MVRVLRLVSKSHIMKADGNLGVVLRWLGGGAGTQASATSKQSNGEAYR